MYFFSVSTCDKIINSPEKTKKWTKTFSPDEQSLRSLRREFSCRTPRKLASLFRHQEHGGNFPRGQEARLTPWHSRTWNGVQEMSREIDAEDTTSLAARPRRETNDGTRAYHHQRSVRKKKGALPSSWPTRCLIGAVTAIDERALRPPCCACFCSFPLLSPESKTCSSPGVGFGAFCSSALLVYPSIYSVCRYPP